MFTPVALPLGRLRLSNSPTPIGSAAVVAAACGCGPKIGSRRPALLARPCADTRPQTAVPLAPTQRGRSPADPPASPAAVGAGRVASWHATDERLILTHVPSLSFLEGRALLAVAR